MRHQLESMCDDQIGDLLHLLGSMETKASERTDRLRAMLVHAQSNPARFDEAAPLRNHLREEADQLERELEAIHRILYLADPQRRANPWEAEDSTLKLHRLRGELREMEERHAYEGCVHNAAMAMTRDTRRSAGIIWRHENIVGIMPMAFLLLGAEAVHLGRPYSLIIALMVGIVACHLLWRAHENLNDRMDAALEEVMRLLGRRSGR